jgi:hypothetical protein
VNPPGLLPEIVGIATRVAPDGCTRGEDAGVMAENDAPRTSPARPDEQDGETPVIETRPVANPRRTRR